MIVTIEHVQEALVAHHHRSAQTVVPIRVVAQRAHVTTIHVCQNRHAAIRAARAHAQNQTVLVQSHEAKAVIHAMETIKRIIAPLANLTRFFDYNFFFNIFCFFTLSKNFITKKKNIFIPYIVRRTHKRVANQVNQSMK